MIKGRVAQINSLSASDGPGLRYCVFLSGCLLRCVFCHNADLWGVDSGKETDSEEIMSGIIRAMPYISGVTLSGGEPLSQPEFAREILRMSRGMGLNTAVQTSGNAPLEAADIVFEACDYAFIDIKGATSSEYDRITQNTGTLGAALTALEKALERGCAVIARMVIIPGINDSECAVDGLASLLIPYPSVKIQLLGYHTMGIGKWSGKSPLDGVPAMDSARLGKLIQRLGKRALL